MMISGIYTLMRLSECIRAHENGDVPPPAPANWKDIIASLEALVQRAEKEASIARGQAPPPVPVVEVPPLQAPAVAPPPREVHREAFMSTFGNNTLQLLMAIQIH